MLEMRAAHKWQDIKNYNECKGTIKKPLSNAIYGLNPASCLEISGSKGQPVSLECNLWLSSARLNSLWSFASHVVSLFINCNLNCDIKPPAQLIYMFSAIVLAGS